MWSASAVRRTMPGLALAASLMLAGCTLAPVHGSSTGSTIAPIALNYAEPQSRLEQIVYQTLGARFRSGDATSPVVWARVSARSSQIGLSRVASPVTDRQIDVTIVFEVTENNTVVASGSRSATALYQTTDQSVADDAALRKAEDQAARAAADAVRLALIAALPAR
ncbi:MAG TPA: hypothetical protein VNS12_08875 [Pelagibacterium sp.]|uniref:hypothetical protein n=1 Tax=Pelagibacterium sp. TaxID=1967288 RepID=UPI002C90D821|nr:hypothetical protein [Pelagibacterium sp.]HWJ88168.1 hypothetical protein [Pelagibacterium sp.]